MKKYTMTIYKKDSSGNEIVVKVHNTNNLAQVEKWWVDYAYTGNDMSERGFNSRYEVINNKTGKKVFTF